MAVTRISERPPMALLTDNLSAIVILADRPVNGFRTSLAFHVRRCEIGIKIPLGSALRLLQSAASRQTSVQRLSLSRWRCPIGIPGERPPPSLQRRVQRVFKGNLSLAEAERQANGLRRSLWAVTRRRTEECGKMRGMEVLPPSIR